MTIKYLASILILIFTLTSFCAAQAQTPTVLTVNFKAEPNSVQLAAEGDVAEMRLEVLNTAGDVVYESQTLDSKLLKWELQDSTGMRVRDGIYMCTITYRNAAGKVRKRIEQVMVSGAKEKGDGTNEPSAVQDIVQTSGSPTTGRIPKFTSASTIGNSIITEDSGEIGIGTSSPSSRLTVSGGDVEIRSASRGVRFSDGSLQTTAALSVVQHNTTLTGNGTAASLLSVANLGVGNAQLASAAVTGGKIAVPLSLSGNNANPILSVTNTGSGAAISTTGAINTSTQYNIGDRRVLSVPGNNNAFVGLDAGNVNTGSGNAFFGSFSGRRNSTGISNSFFGTSAGSFNDTGNGNSFFGRDAGLRNSTGNSNSFFGVGAGNANSGGDNNTIIGFQAGTLSVGDNNTLIGFRAEGSNGITNSTALGANASVTQSNSVVLGNNASVGIGTTAPRAKLQVQAGDVYISSANNGIILRAQNNTCRRVTLSNAGTLVVSASFTCP